MVDIGEKLADVAFENPAISGVIPARLSGEYPESINRFMSSFLVPAGIGIADESPIEERV